MTVGGGQVRIHHAGLEVTCYDRRLGRRERAVDRAHLHGIVPRQQDLSAKVDTDMPRLPAIPPGLELLRPLAEYKQVMGRGW